MLKKFLCLTTILFFIFSLITSCYSTDLLMDLENNTSSVNNSQVVDNTIYSNNQKNEQNSAQIDVSDVYTEPLTTTSEADYDDYDDELSISSIINIILITIGFVLVLLGIAIIIKLK